MHIVTVGIESISIYTKTQEKSTTFPLYGVSGDEISNIDELQTSINRLIEKHEEEHFVQVEEVQIICDIFGHEIIKASKIQNIQAPTGKIITHGFQMKTCRIYEVFNEKELKTLISCFVGIGINVEKVLSFFSLFSVNAKTVIDSNKIGVLHIAKQITLYTFDGAGSLQDIYRINRGLDDVIQYISLSTLAKFPHLTRRAVTLILQNFICFSELDMIEKIHNVKGVNKELMAVVNYETVKFISNLLLRYMKQIWADLNPPMQYRTIIIHTQREFLGNIVRILSMISSQDMVKIKKDWLVLNVQEKKKDSMLKEVLSVFSLKRKF